MLDCTQVPIDPEHDGEVAVTELLREHGISRPTCRVWRDRYAEAAVAELTKLKARDAEHAMLKRMQAELAMAQRN